MILSDHDEHVDVPLEVRKSGIFKARSPFFKAFCHIPAVYCGDVTKYARDLYKIVFLTVPFLKQHVNCDLFSPRVVRIPGKGNSNSHCARPVHRIIAMIQWSRTSRLSIKNSLHDPHDGRVSELLPREEGTT